jgi:hypothetical protein
MSSSPTTTLLEARDRPHVLDDSIVARFIRLITDELEFLPIYREQLSRWYQAHPTATQILDLDRHSHTNLTGGERCWVSNWR